MPDTVIKQIALTLNALRTCKEKSLSEAARIHEEVLAVLTSMLPRGGGFDSGTQIDIDRSTDDKIVMHTSYHHINGSGFYNGWTYHTVTVKPSLIHDYVISVGGRNRNYIKELIHDEFAYVLSNTVPDSMWADAKDIVDARSETKG